MGLLEPTCEKNVAARHQDELPMVSTVTATPVMTDRSWGPVALLVNCMLTASAIRAQQSRGMDGDGMIGEAIQQNLFKNTRRKTLEQKEV